MQNKSIQKRVSLIAALILLCAFFLPWLNWPLGSVSGYDFPSGAFFKQSEKQFGLENPVPQFNLLNMLFWLVPIGAILLAVFHLLHKKTGLVSLVIAALALSLVTVFLLFTQTVVEQVGTVKSIFSVAAIGMYATILAAIAIVALASKCNHWLRIAALVAGPVFTSFGFMTIKNKMLKNHADTATVSSLFSVESAELIAEFIKNDSAANARFREKIVTVTGKASEVEIVNDSTVNIKMIDSSGSYAIFPFVAAEAENAKKITVGEKISIKASCSGGDFSEILEVFSINFKRAVLIN